MTTQTGVYQKLLNNRAKVISVALSSASDDKVLALVHAIAPHESHFRSRSGLDFVPEVWNSHGIVPQEAWTAEDHAVARVQQLLHMENELTLAVLAVTTPSFRVPMGQGSVGENWFDEEG